MRSSRITPWNCLLNCGNEAMDALKTPIWILTGVFFLLAVVLRREKETLLLLVITTAVIAAWSFLCGLMAYFSWRESGQLNPRWVIFFLVSAVVVKVSFDRFRRLRSKTGKPRGQGIH